MAYSTALIWKSGLPAAPSAICSAIISATADFTNSERMDSRSHDVFSRGYAQRFGIQINDTSYIYGGFSIRLRRQ